MATVVMTDVWGKGGVKWDVLYMTRATVELLHDNLHPPAEPHFLLSITTIMATRSSSIETRLSNTAVNSANVRHFLQSDSNSTFISHPAMLLVSIQMNESRTPCIAFLN